MKSSKVYRSGHAQKNYNWNRLLTKEKKMKFKTLSVAVIVGGLVFFLILTDSVGRDIIIPEMP